MFGNWRQNRWSARHAARRLNGSANGHLGLLVERTVLAKVAIGLLVATATVVVIDSGGPPFPYRLGQTVQRDVRAKTKFEKINETRTAKRQDQAAEDRPPIYTNNPRPIEELRTSVDSLAESIASAKSFDQLPDASAREWGLSEPAFTALYAAMDTPEKYQATRNAIGEILGDLQAHGLFDAKAQPDEVLQGSRVQVRNHRAGELVTWDVRDVSRETWLKGEGPDKGPLLAREFSRKLPPQAGAHLFQLLAPRLERLPGTLSHDAQDEEETQKARQLAREAVPKEKDTYNPGDRLVKQDEAISEEQLGLLRSEHEEWVASRSRADKLRRNGSLAALVLGLFALAGYYIVRFERRLVGSLTRLSLLSVLVVATVGLAKRLHGDVLHGETIPLALAAMMLAIVYSQQFALLITFGMGLLCSWMFGTGLNDFIVLTGGTAAAVLSVTRVRSRSKLITVGATAGATYFALTWATGLLAGQPADMLLADSLRRLLWGIFAGLLVGGSLPFLEKIFGIVTDINLLELSDVSHPLLLELMRKAPGTYNHSVAVATLAEAAAEQIGANSLLVRVGSYFHDVGKMLKPHYFVENQTDSVNRHEALNPAMSTLIIIGHVKDGANLAHEHHLPEPIIDLIEQHHGTTLVEYFYKEATREVEEDVEKEADVEEAAFRYPGPKPQTKEACIVMLADAVESASRTLSEPTPGRIEGLVHELTLKRLLDGQFDDCSITLQEIAIIQESLIKSLNAIYHSRVKYPEQITA